MKTRIINVVTIAGLLGNAAYHHQEMIKVKLNKKEKPELQPSNQPVEFPQNPSNGIEKKSNDIRSKYSDTKPTYIDELAATFYGKTNKVKGKSMPSGDGMLYYDDQRTQIGSFTDGALNGKGLMFDPQQGTLVGEFSNGQLNGVGQLTTTAGNQYQGEFRDNKPYGKGNLNFANSNQCYTTRTDDKYNVSCYTRSKKLFYDGEFNGEEAHGKGKMLLNDKGYTYEGDFVDGKRVGYGVERDSYGDIVYQGKYEDNHPTEKLALYEETIGYFVMGTINILFSFLL